MKKGYLSEYFSGVAVKILSQVEANPNRSHQHEFGTTPEMRGFLETKKQEFETRFIWVGDEQEGVPDLGYTTMYDCREKQSHRSPEWRIYYNSNDVTDMMQPGETLFVAMRHDRSLLIIVTPTDSTIRNQLLWLFGFDGQPTLKFDAQKIDDGTGELDFAARFVLDEIGIEYEDPEANSLDAIVERFGTTFPKTRDFSALARQTLPEVDARIDPDLALVTWLDHEEAMFRRMERKVVADRLTAGFTDGESVDVDSFLSFSLSVQNRRKSRMGLAFENHLEAVFAANELQFDTQATTERNNKPDFLFPSSAAYADQSFPVALLTMLGAKSTCKERWRQVLPEADRIDTKHLATLEPSISETQTDQMKESSVQLVVPTSIQRSYSPQQRDWLLSMADFVQLVIERAAH